MTDFSGLKSNDSMDRKYYSSGCRLPVSSIPKPENKDIKNCSWNKSLSIFK